MGQGQNKCVIIRFGQGLNKLIIIRFSVKSQGENKCIISRFARLESYLRLAYRSGSKK
jgi:hypothetical protein